MRVCGFCFAVVDGAHACDAVMPHTELARGADRVSVNADAEDIEPDDYDPPRVVVLPSWFAAARYIDDTDAMEIDIDAGGYALRCSFTDEECANLMRVLSQLRERRQLARSSSASSRRRS